MKLAPHIQTCPLSGTSPIWATQPDYPAMLSEAVRADNHPAMELLLGDKLQLSNTNIDDISASCSCVGFTL